MNAKILGIALGLLTCAACGGKGGDNGPTGGGNGITEDNLTAQDWGIVAIESSMNEKAGAIANAIPEQTLADDGFSRPTYKAFLELKANKLEDVKICEADDVYTFKAEGIVSYSNSATDCDGSIFTSDAVVPLPATWWLTDKILRIAKENGDTLAYTILTLNTTTLEYERRGNAKNFINYTPNQVIEIVEKYTFEAN